VVIPGFKPDVNPIDNLASELSTLSAGAGFTQLSQASIAASLLTGARGSQTLINKIRKSLRQQIVIVIDQLKRSSDTARLNQGHRRR